MVARPSDRFAAFVIDHLIVLAPILALLRAPFERQWKEALLLGHETMIAVQILNAGLVMAACLLVYHVTFLRLVGGSLGQLIMGLRVVSSWSSEAQPTRLGLWNIVLRNVAWLLTPVLLGIPFFAMWSDERRRTWYDRVSDSMVVTVKHHKAAQTPHLFHKSVVEGFFAAVFLFAIFAVTSYLWRGATTDQLELTLSSTLEDDGVVCEGISDVQSDWPTEDGREAQRLSVVLSLFLADQLDESCLEREFDDRTFVNQQDALARLVKSFAYGYQPDLSDMYLNSVCDANTADRTSYPCQAARLIMGHLKSSDGEVALLKAAPVYVLLLQLRQELKLGRPDRAAWILDHLPKIPAFQRVNGIARTKLEVMTGDLARAEGVWSALAFSEAEELLSTTSWLCRESLAQSCAAKDREPCQQVAERLTSKKRKDLDPEVLFTRVALTECDGGPDIDERTESAPEIQAFVEARKMKDLQTLRSLALDQDLFPALRASAFRALLNLNPDESDLSLAMDTVTTNALGWAGRSVAEGLLQYFNTTRDYEKSVQVGELLESRQTFLPLELLRILVIAEHNMGRLKRAREFADQVRDKFPAAWTLSLETTRTRSSDTGRGPAAASSAPPVEEFDLVLRALMDRDGAEGEDQ
jgi:uncharacterized RDD family membrane protein YckC